MSAAPRCHDCAHPRGLRAAGRMATNANTGAVTAKKPACRCACHEKEGVA